MEGVQAPKRIVGVAPGRRLPLLLDPNGIPNVLVALYMLDDCKPRSAPFTTLCNRMQGVGALLAYLRLSGVDDLAAHFGSGFPDRVWLEGFAAHLVGPESRPLTSAPANFDEAVRFVCWLAPRVQKVGLAAFKAAHDEFERHARYCRPAASQGIRLGLTQGQREVFEGAIMPGAPGNPFSERMVFRNFVLCRVSFELGLRAGELLGLKLEDLEIRDRVWLHIVKRQNDVDDPRTPPAAQKTLARDLLVSDDLAGLLEDLLEERDEWPGTDAHPFIFVNVSGRPLGHRGLRKIFQTLRRELPQLAGLVNHVLRHDRADRFHEDAEARGLDRVQAIRDLELLMGWTPGSAMTARYGQRSQLDIANRHALRLQRRAFEGFGR